LKKNAWVGQTVKETKEKLPSAVRKYRKRGGSRKVGGGERRTRKDSWDLERRGCGGKASGHQVAGWAKDWNVVCPKSIEDRSSLRTQSAKKDM